MESPSELIALLNDGLAYTAGFDPKRPIMTVRSKDARYEFSRGLTNKEQTPEHAYARGSTLC
jgi:hypothetical protein